MTNRRMIGGEREIKSELFLDEKDQFVFHRPGRRGFGELWVGGDSSTRWLQHRMDRLLWVMKT